MYGNKYVNGNLKTSIRNRISAFDMNANNENDSLNHLFLISHCLSIQLELTLSFQQSGKTAYY